MARSKVPNLTKNFQKYIKQLHKAAEAAVFDWIKNDMRALSDAYVPEDTGELRESFFQDKLRTSGKTFLSIQVGYGKNLTGKEGYSYAAEMHELTRDVNWTKAGSGPRYLERAMMETKSQILPKVKQYTQRVKI